MKKRFKKIITYILPVMIAALMAFSCTETTFADDEDTEAEEVVEDEGEYSEDDGEEAEYDEADAEGEDTGETDAGTESDENADTSVETDEDGWPIAPEVLSGSIKMIEVNTGAVLYSKDSDVQRYPASTTKVLTCLVALENSSMNEVVTFSANAVDLEEGATSIDAVEGEQLSMKDCLYGLMLPSGNDCAIAIAEHIAGSVDAFVEMMNEKALELGCENSHFTNPHGLYNSDHYTTADDLCKIAQAAFNNSAFVEIVSHATYTIEATNKSEARLLENTDYMIVQNSSYYNEDVVGGKTGYLYESGRCLVTLAKKNGMTVICVAMFCQTYMGVFTDTEELLDYVFNGFALRNIAEEESRFSFAYDKAKIYLDMKSQILMPQAIETSDLDSEIKFTYDMDRDEFDEATANAGITSKDGRHLYAILNYSYAGHFLGSINVIINDNMTVTTPSFASTKYVSIWWYLLAIAILAALVVLFSILIKKAPEHRRRKTRVIKTQTADGRPIPLNIINASSNGRVTQTSASKVDSGKIMKIEIEPDEPVKRTRTRRDDEEQETYRKRRVEDSGERLSRSSRGSSARK